MFIVRGLKAFGVATLFATNTLVAQERKVVVFAHGGGYSSTSDLNNSGTADFDLGFQVGGGIGWNFSKNVGVRGDFTFARSDFDDDAGLGLQGAEINRYYYGADVQIRLPLRSFVPYVFGGAGGVTLDPQDTSSLDSFTRLAGRFGLGLSYRIANSRLSIFSQGTGWVYDFDGGTLDGTQFDVGWVGGLTIGL